MVDLLFASSFPAAQALGCLPLFRQRCFSHAADGCYSFATPPPAPCRLAGPLSPAAGTRQLRLLPPNALVLDEKTWMSLPLLLAQS